MYISRELSTLLPKCVIQPGFKQIQITVTLCTQMASMLLCVATQSLCVPNMPTTDTGF